MRNCHSSKGLIHYQSTCPEFKNRDRKVLSTQPHPTHESTSTHCVLHLNLIKGIFKTCILDSPHTSIHLSNQHGITSSQTLAYIYHTSSHYIQGSNISWQRSNKHVIISKAWHTNLHIHVHQSKARS